MNSPKRSTQGVFAPAYSAPATCAAALACLAAAPNAIAAEPAHQATTVAVVPYLGLGDGADAEVSGDQIYDPPALGVHVHAELRPWRRFGLGVLVGGQPWGRGPAYGTTNERSTTLWRAAAEGRAYAYSGAAVQLWLAVEAGGIAVRDNVPGSDAQTAFSPTLGAAVGWDRQVGENLSLGLEIRGFYADANLPPRVDPWSNDRAPRPRSQPVTPIALGFAARWKI